MINEISFDDQPDLVEGVPWTWWDLFVVIGFTFGGLIVGGLITGGAYVFLDLPLAEESLPVPLFFILGSVIYLALIVGIYWRTVRHHQISWSSLGVHGSSLQWLLAVPVLFVLQMSAAAAVNLLLVAPFVGGEFENPQIEALSGGNPLTFVDFVLLFILVAVLAPIAEELFFRGMLYPLLRKRFSLWPAIMIDSIVFAVVHFLLVLVPALFVIGLFLTWLRAQSQSVLPSIFLHMLQNGLAIVSIYLILQTGLP